MRGSMQSEVRKDSKRALDVFQLVLSFTQCTDAVSFHDFVSLFHIRNGSLLTKLATWVNRW